MALTIVAFAVGCSDQKPSAPKTTATPATPPAAEQKHAGHGAGPHEGTLADWGGGKYHVEFTVDHGKQEATVYILGSDEKTASPIATKDVKLLLSITDPKFQVELAPVPLQGEADGMASRFVGRHENLGKAQQFSGTISGEVDGTPYAGDFTEQPHGAPEKK